MCSRISLFYAVATQLVPATSPACPWDKPGSEGGRKTLRVKSLRVFLLAISVRELVKQNCSREDCSIQRPQSNKQNGSLKGAVSLNNLLVVTVRLVKEATKDRDQKRASKTGTLFEAV